MKLQQHKKTPYVIGSIISLIFTVLIVCGAVYALTGSLFGWNPKASEMSTQDQQKEAGSQIKENAAVSKDGVSGSDQPATPVKESSGKEKVELTVTSAMKVESTLKVSTLISALDTSGTCKITISDLNGTVLHTSTVGVQALSSTSTCKGFDIPASDIQEGNYKVTVTFESGAKYGLATYESK